jgi:hypothetical protein
MTNQPLTVGDHVQLITPENERLHGAVAEVSELTSWGAIVLCDRAATGHFRAAFSEMAPVVVPSGDVCSRCGSPNMTRAGSCLLCRDCGDTSGGCS